MKNTILSWKYFPLDDTASSSVGFRPFPIPTEITFAFSCSFSAAGTVAEYPPLQFDWPSVNKITILVELFREVGRSVSSTSFKAKSVQVYWAAQTKNIKKSRNETLFEKDRVSSVQNFNIQISKHYWTKIC